MRHRGEGWGIVQLQPSPPSSNLQAPAVPRRTRWSGSATRGLRRGRAGPSQPRAQTRRQSARRRRSAPSRHAGAVGAVTRGHAHVATPHPAHPAAVLGSPPRSCAAHLQCRQVARPRHDHCRSDGDLAERGVEGQLGRRERSGGARLHRVGHCRPHLAPLAPRPQRRPAVRAQDEREPRGRLRHGGDELSWPGISKGLRRSTRRRWWRAALGGEGPHGRGRARTSDTSSALTRCSARSGGRHRGGPVSSAWSATPAESMAASAAPACAARRRCQPA